MKKAWLFFPFMVIGIFVSGQTPSEWWQQKNTQRQYLLQQIAALQVYLRYAKEGYGTANKGLTIIGQLKRGDLDLHKEHFASLEKVNPRIASASTVAAIIANQLQIIKEAKRTVDGAGQNNAFTSEEIAHCKKVFETLLGSCVDVVDELIALTTSGQYKMKDDERMKRTAALYKEMQNNYAFTVAYATEMGLLSLQRVSEQTELDYANRLRKRL